MSQLLPWVADSLSWVISTLPSIPLIISAMLLTDLVLIPTSVSAAHLSTPIKGMTSADGEGCWHIQQPTVNEAAAGCKDHAPLLQSLLLISVTDCCQDSLPIGNGKYSRKKGSSFSRGRVCMNPLAADCASTSPHSSSSFHLWSFGMRRWQNLLLISEVVHLQLLRIVFQ